MVADRDGDGVRDADDACPKTAGDTEFDGCPDTDNDDIRDSNDDCPQQDGLEELNGCPNTEPDVSQIQIRDTVNVDEPVSATVTGSDPDGHDLTYRWSNGATGEGTSYTFSTAGMRTVSVEVTDGHTTVTRSQQIEVLRPDAVSMPNDTDDATSGGGSGGTQPRTELGPIENLFYTVIDFLGGLA